MAIAEFLFFGGANRPGMSGMAGECFAVELYHHTSPTAIYIERSNDCGYSILCLYRTWLYRNTYISLLIPEDSAKPSRDNLYESKDSYTGTLFIPEIFLSRPYKFFMSGTNRDYCRMSIYYAVS